MDKAIQIQHDEDWENSLIAAQKAGFRHVSMGFGSSKVFHADGWEAEIARIKARLDALGLLCVQTHMPYYDLRISSEIKDAAMEKALLRSIKATALLGARFCACHPRSAFDHDFSVRLALKDNTEAIRTLLPTAEENGVIIALENLPIFPWNTKWRFYPWNAEDLCTLADNLDSRQIYFVNQIVEYIVHNGMMKDLSVLQETPFTDQGSIVEIFTNLTVWMGIRKAIEQVNANALAA